MGNFALNSLLNGKKEKHGRKAEEHKSCELLFRDGPEPALKGRHCALLAAVVFSFRFQQVAPAREALEGFEVMRNVFHN
ncbi:hypothetical protein VULLAG_LOCUS22841 [Vulpes lagopus]